MTHSPLEAFDDEVIQVDGNEENFMPEKAKNKPYKDPDDPDAPPPTPYLYLDDYEDALDFVGSDSLLSMNKQDHID